MMYKIMFKTDETEYRVGELKAKILDLLLLRNRESITNDTDSEVSFKTSFE